MKKFIIKIVFWSLIPIGILVVSLFFIPNNKIPDNSLFANIDKQERLKTITGRKIVLVGGSNLPFGVKSHMIEEQTGIPVVNMGLHAGLGMNYILSEVEASIHENDIVIVSLEYHHFLSKAMYNGEDVLVAMAFDVNRESMRHIKLPQWISLLPNICLYSSKKLINIHAKPIDEFEVLFTRESFNEYGDEVAHYGLASTIKSGEKPTLSTDIYPKSIKRLQEFANVVETKQATLLLVACPYPEKQYYQDSAIINKITREIQKSGLDFCIKPEDCIFPDSLMFNSFFHLSEEGATIRTEQLKTVIEECF